MNQVTRHVALAAVLAVSVAAAAAESPDPQQRARECPSCAEWNAPQEPVRIFGNSWWVGSHGLGAILVTSPGGHVLIDGGLPEGAPLVEENIRAAGFRIQDVKLILNSHAHFDHAGAIAQLQRASGAEVAASAPSAKVLELGASVPGDPQHGEVLAFPAVRHVRPVEDGEVLRVGPIALTARFTPGHTPGGTTWTWRSCEGSRCLDLVYADSQTPISAEGFLFTRNDAFPDAVRAFERGQAVLDQLPCDVLITPHPSASKLWERVEARGKGSADALVDPQACRRYAADAREMLARRIAREQQADGVDAPR